MKSHGSSFRNRAPLAWLAVLVGLAAAPAAAQDRPGPGRVDASPFIRIAGDQAVTIEVNLAGPLLQAIGGVDPELKQLVGGLESLQAVILKLDAPGVIPRIRKAVTETEESLLRQRWSRLALVREADEEVRVLVLADGETVRGLVVMVIDGGAGEMVFANIFGVLDLAAIEKIGGKLAFPGLGKIPKKP